MAATPQESSFGRGAIVRVKLFQFLTYEAACFGVEFLTYEPSLRTGGVPARAEIKRRHGPERHRQKFDSDGHRRRVRCGPETTR